MCRVDPLVIEVLEDRLARRVFAQPPQIRTLQSLTSECHRHIRRIATRAKMNILDFHLETKGQMSIHMFTLFVRIKLITLKEHILRTLTDCKYFHHVSVQPFQYSQRRQSFPRQLPELPRRLSASVSRRHTHRGFPVTL